LSFLKLGSFTGYGANNFGRAAKSATKSAISRQIISIDERYDKSFDTVLSPDILKTGLIDPRSHQDSLTHRVLRQFLAGIAFWHSAFRRVIAGRINIGVEACKEPSSRMPDFAFRSMDWPSTACARF
jgi:hypothetical protein